MCENVKRLGFVGIMIEDLTKAETVNHAISESKEIVVGRLGLPYKDRGVSIISLVVDGTNDEVSALTGRLGRIEGVSVKSMLEKAK